MLGQTTTGTIDVAEDHVRLEVQLPWLLSLLANKGKGLGGEAGEAHAGAASQTEQYAKLIVRGVGCAVLRASFLAFQHPT
jgi:hypothetical protein